MVNKTQPIRSKAIMRSAHGRACVRCGRDDGTTVRAHYEGSRQHQYGKGQGIKGHDFLSATLCYQCHLDMSGKKTLEHSEEFLHLIALTLIEDFKIGVVTIKGAKS